MLHLALPSPGSVQFSVVMPTWTWDKGELSVPCEWAIVSPLIVVEKYFEPKRK